MRSPTFLLALGLLVAPAVSRPSDEPPAIVALTLDTSGSISPDLIEQTRSLAASLLEALPPESEVALFVFDDTSRLVLERTNDKAVLRQALGEVKRAGRYTVMYDALYQASRYLEIAPRSRKAIVLVTDGNDENSTLTQDDGLKVATAARIPIFTVGVGRIEEAVLDRIAKLTGGAFAGMSQVRVAQMAATISALQPVGAPVASSPPAPAASGSEGQTSSPASGPSLGLLVLAGVALLGFGLAFLILASRAGRRRAVVAPRVFEAPPEVSGDGLLVETMVGRAPDQDTIAPTMMLRGLPVLRVTSGVEAGRVVEIGGGRVVTIGRSPTNDLALREESVSAEHCRIKPEGDGFVLYDSKSTNGTLVNGEQVERQVLREGDVITVGKVAIRFGKA